MRFHVAMFAVAVLIVATAGPSFAQKGHGGYGGGAYGYHHHGYGGYGYGYCGHGCNSHHGYHAALHALRHYNGFGNVPALPPPAFNPGPATPTVTYPYYTVRGPRDFLLPNPPPLGP